MVTVRFAGSGDAFGTGGRLQACILLEGGPAPVLLDCGATSLVALKRAGIDPGSIPLVVVSHLHGDHFGGLPFLILDGQFSRRELPLTFAGPPGIEARVTAAMEVLFPGSSTVTRRFETRFVELEPGATRVFEELSVSAFAADHASGAPALCLRVEYGGKVIVYSGDTAWTPALLDAARGSDVFICEAYTFERPVRYHLDYTQLREQLPALDARRVIVTHMGPGMLARVDEIDADRGVVAAFDGAVFEIG
jgi:ribonuclease BN (tRNA processing enzyme)